MINSPAEPVPAVDRASAPGLPAPSSPPATPLAPMPGAYHWREVVAQPITPNDFPRLVSLVQALAPDAGSARQLGDGLQWEHDSGFSALSLTINPEPAGTVIRADLRTDGRRVAFGLGAAGTGLAAALGATAAHLPLGATLGIGAGALVAASWLAQRLWRASSRYSAERLQQLVERIAAGLRGELD